MTPEAAAAPSALFPVALPVLLALALWSGSLRATALRLAPFAALPAALTAVGILPVASGYWPWVMLGTRLSVADDLARTALLFTSVLWLAAGLFARGDVGVDEERSETFWGYWLATLSGNLGVVAAQDVASFYLFFSLMTFASYGLILHERSAEAARAGRVYISMAVFGEVLLLAAFLLLASTHGNLPLALVPEAVAASPYRDALAVLLLAGFGVKAGMVPLHLWLPLAHPVAPTAASAVLSGALIKAGVLGWLRFLPLGESQFPTLGPICVLAGIVAAGGAALIGVTQRDPKTVLAYSSVSQMGFLTLTVGVALSTSAASGALTAAAIAYVVHHALAKGALFLGAGVLHNARRSGLGWVVVAGLVWSGLEIAGAPLTSGAFAKLSLKKALEETPSGLAGGHALSSVLSVLAVGSTLLMARFWQLVTRPDWSGGQPVRLALFVPWALLLGADTLVLLLVPGGTLSPAALFSRQSVVSALWPVVLGLSGAVLVTRACRRRGISLRAVPAGDLLVPLVAIGRAFRRSLGAVQRALWTQRSAAVARELGIWARAKRALDVLIRTDHELGDLGRMGVVMVIWVGAMLLAVLR